MTRESVVVLKALNKFIGDQVGKLQLRVYQGLTISTPVDTGFARSVWTPSLGSASSTSGVPPRDRQAAQAAASSNISRNRGLSAQIAQTYAIAKGDIFISNNAPYIGRLNAGTSAQAPAKFVEAVVVRAVRG